MSNWNRRFVLSHVIVSHTDVPVQMEDLIQEKVVQKENELNATYDEKMRNYEERYEASSPSWLLRKTNIHAVASKICSASLLSPRTSFATCACHTIPTRRSCSTIPSARVGAF